MTAYDRLLLPENLTYAWKKAKRLYWTADGYTDSGEVADFELNLEQRLLAIHRQFERGNWRLKKARPLPRPKKIESDVPIDRQYYHVSIDDQVAWIAVVNALGPELDQLMPPWSYGNRLYRPAWYEHGEDRQSTLEIGPYRHATGHLFRKFQHSWPLFRRHVALTARAMARALPSRQDLDEADRLAAISAKKEGLRYLQADFWVSPTSSGHKSRLYHAAVDLRHFYPSVRTEAVLKGLAASGTMDERMHDLLVGMLQFRVDTSQMPPDTMQRVDPVYDKREVRGIPTGLFVAGFLANAAMLPVDSIVSERVEEKRSLAHFRYVDDHIVLAYEFDDLCAWLEDYGKLLIEYGTGAEINPDKYDPPQLGEWMVGRIKALSGNGEETWVDKGVGKKIREDAVRVCEIDGGNPTQLLTKTLGQISAIAAANVDILDDEDLEERLKLLEWLLLANIPEREIRPDTRAAFAAGQIATLAPLLVREAEELVETARSLEDLRAQGPNVELATAEDVARHAASVKELSEKLGMLRKEQARGEVRLLRHCFGLLLQAFREYPGKPRLFYRMHEFCRLTGFRGLKDIGTWIKEVRAGGQDVWANYYAGLSLHILARGVLLAGRTLLKEDALRSDKEAAVNHLEDVCQIDSATFLVPQRDEAWFHAVTRKEFGVALLSVSAVVSQDIVASGLEARLRQRARQYAGVSFDKDEEVWEHETGRRPGVWAHLAESVLSIDGRPSGSWDQFVTLFSFSHVAEILASRRYPELMSDRGWHQLLQAKKALPETDSGLLREAMEGHAERVTAALSAKKIAFTRAARSLERPVHGWITLTEWTRSIAQDLSAFDPRRSEWTALELVRQLVGPIVDDVGVQQSRLDRLHPNNVLVPEAWKSNFPCRRDRVDVTWERWRNFVVEASTGRVKLRALRTSVLDYRYFTETHGGRRLNDWERRLMGVGRLLLGQLMLRHEAPRVWNIRGNEHIFHLPWTQWFRSLAMSSRTLLLIESCLGARSAETRAIALNPGLFGWMEGRQANDADLDPPLLVGPNELLTAIEGAQTVLVENQLAVAMNQPRQLIPFRLTDFAAGPGEDGEVDGYGE